MQDDYCVLMRARSQQHPLLTWDQEYLHFLKPAPVVVHEPVKLKLGEPIPPRPVMVDHHSLPAPVVSTRVKEALEDVDLHGAQLVPADVQVGDFVLRYWLVHMWRSIRCMDRNRSIFEASRSGLTVRARRTPSRRVADHAGAHRTASGQSWFFGRVTVPGFSMAARAARSR